MKRWLLLLLLLIVLFLAGVYFFIPSNLTVSKIELVKCSPGGAFRVLNNKNNWSLWWPGTILSQPDPEKGFIYNGFTYKISQHYLIGLIIATQNDKLNTSGAVRVLPLGPDSIAIEWKTDVAVNGNPIRKIVLYEQAKRLKKNMTEILSRAKSFLEKEENVYGMRIEKTKVKDTLLVASKSFTTEYPSVETIYKMVNTLKDYISKQGANETDPPMLHVKANDSTHYETMVAIPVDKILPESKSVLFKRMFSGNILEAEIKGGPYTVRQSFKQLTNYVNDYGRESPAIPFESLITDRSKETDTTKWVTRLYYPVY